jgi:hypothetical protein
MYNGEEMRKENVFLIFYSHDRRNRQKEVFVLEKDENSQEIQEIEIVHGIQPKRFFTIFTFIRIFTFNIHFNVF